MATLDSDKQYEQLNQRTLWYTSQVWYVPFAFIGILAIGIEKINDLPGSLRSFAFLMLSLFSLAVYVHVSSLKFYEHKNILDMQRLEDPVISSGGSPWYLSFTAYMKLILAFCAVALMWIWSIDFSLIYRLILIVSSIMLIVVLWVGDRKRNKSILDKIRANGSNQ